MGLRLKGVVIEIQSGPGFLMRKQSSDLLNAFENRWRGSLPQRRELDRLNIIRRGCGRPLGVEVPLHGMAPCPRRDATRVCPTLVLHIIAMERRLHVAPNAEFPVILGPRPRLDVPHRVPSAGVRVRIAHNKTREVVVAFSWLGF